MRTANLKHRDKLLADIVAGLAAVERVTVVHVKVTFTCKGHPIKEWLGLVGALESIANDLYWDDEGNWADADGATVGTY